MGAKIVGLSSRARPYRTSSQDFDSHQMIYRSQMIHRSRYTRARAAPLRTVLQPSGLGNLCQLAVRGPTRGIGSWDPLPRRTKTKRSVGDPRIASQAPPRPDHHELGENDRHGPDAETYGASVTEKAIPPDDGLAWWRAPWSPLSPCRTSTRTLHRRTPIHILRLLIVSMASLTLRTRRECGAAAMIASY